MNRLLLKGLVVVAVITAVIVAMLQWRYVRDNSDSGQVVLEPSRPMESAEEDGEVQARPEDDEGSTGRAIYADRTAIALLAEPEGTSAEYLGAVASVTNLLERGLHASRTRIVLLQREAVSGLFADASSGQKQFEVSFDLSVFPDSPCALSSFEKLQPIIGVNGWRIDASCDGRSSTSVTAIYGGESRKVSFIVEEHDPSSALLVARHLVVPIEDSDYSLAYTEDLDAAMREFARGQ